VYGAGEGTVLRVVQPLLRCRGYCDAGGAGGITALGVTVCQAKITVSVTKCRFLFSISSQLLGLLVAHALVSAYFVVARRVKNALPRCSIARSAR
jgi:hypothetical protein